MINRTIQPNTILPTSIALPEHHCVTLANDLKLYVMPSGEQRVVRLSLVFNVGSRHQTHPFTASAMLNMLSEGTERYTSAELAEWLDFYGIYYDTSIDRDFSMITINCLNKFLPKALEFLEQIIFKPTFPDKDFEIYKTKRKQQLRIEREKPSYLARELFSKSLFGDQHPYGMVSSEDEYDTLAVGHLREYFSRYFGAENCFAVASGFLSSEEESNICVLLSQLPHCELVNDNYNAVCTPISKAILERPSDLQSSIRIGKLLFPKGHPDFNGMQLLSMVLGGYFGSRLVTNLREERGYTYGIYAAMSTLKHEGYFAIATDVAAEFTSESVEQIFAEIERLRTELVPMEELEVVKNMVIGELMRLLDGPFGIADVVIENIQSNLESSYLNEFLQEIRATTPQRLKELAVQYLDSQSFTTVIVGRTAQEVL